MKSAGRPSVMPKLCCMDHHRMRPEQLLLLARVFERTGDRVGAVVAYREVVLAGDAAVAAEAKRRLRVIAAGGGGPSG